MQQTGELFSIKPSTHLFIVFSTIVSSLAVDHTRFSRHPSDRPKREKTSEPESKPYRRRFSLFLYEYGLIGISIPFFMHKTPVHPSANAWNRNLPRTHFKKLLFPQQPQSDGPDHQDSSRTHKSSRNRRECGNQHGCGTRHLSVKRAVCKRGNPYTLG